MPATLKRAQGYSLTNILVVIGLIMLVAATYYYISKANDTTETIFVIQSEQQQPSREDPALMANQDPTEDSTKSRIPPLQPADPLPLLDYSDKRALAASAKMSSSTPAQGLLVEQEVIRNFVVFIDNFSRGDLVAYFTPLVRPQQQFSVNEFEQLIYLDTESYQRYDIYAQFIDNIDVSTAIEQYRTLQPLIDEAYQEIGYPGEEFTERIYEAIELILDAPIIDHPIELISPSVMYKFADPDLEDLPDAQKLLIRMGPDNTIKIQAKLRSLKHALMAF